MLNEKQKLAISTEGNVLIIAGAGTGKTTTLTEKIRSLLKSGVSEEEILAITYTNKAAKEMKERLDNENVRITTFHSFAAVELRKVFEYSDAFGNVDSNFIISDSEKSLELVKYLIKELYPDYSKKYKIIKELISFSKNRGVSHLESSFEEKLNEILADDQRLEYIGISLEKFIEIFKTYQKLNELNNFLDFDDLILYFNYFSERKLLDYEFKYILIDEAQDMNVIQYKLVKSIKGDATLFVVGDFDQSIYKWRGSDPKILQRLETDYNFNRIILEESYRFDNKILDIAEHLIQRNDNRFEKNLFTNKVSNNDIELNVFNSAYEEAKFVVDEIVKINDFKNTAILFRNFSVLSEIKKELESREIPYTTLDDAKLFYQQKEIKTIINLITFLFNTSNNIALIKVLEDLKIVGPTVLKKIRSYVINGGVDVYSKFNRKDITLLGLTVSHLLPLASFKMKNDILKKKIDSKEIPLYDLICDYLDTFGLLSDNASTLIEPLKNSTGYDYNEDLKVFLDVVAEETENEKLIDLRLDGVVNLITIHSAKGLEFKNVFVIGVENHIFPKNVYDDLEEERRLLYVAITRAIEKLYVSACNYRWFYGIINETGPSILFKELKKEA